VPDATLPPDRFCPSCGTEIDAEARFCPTCGTMLSEEASPDLPAAPAWPPPEEPAAQPPQLARDEPRPPTPAASTPSSEPGVPETAPQVPVPPGSPGPSARDGSGPNIDLPLTWPTTLSGWLIGGGSLVGALALIPSLDDAVSLVLFLALLAVAASVFLAERLPEVPRERFIVLGVTLVGLGIAFDRAGFGARGIDSILLVAMIAAAGGALLIELDRDRPLPPAPRAGDPPAA
jgi:hypothetical protein